MAEKKESIEISYKANINDLKKKLETLPDITSQEAKKMVSALDRQLKQAERAAKQSSKDFEKLASSAGMVAGAFGAMGAGIVMFSQEVADLTNELTDASAKSGIAIETLAGLRLAAEGSGLEFSNLEGGLIKFQSSISEAAKGSKSLSESFSQIGVEVKNADGTMRDANDVFNDSIKALGEMENTTERNALAMKLFGKQGGAGLIQSGALDNLENMTSLAKEFGVAIDENAVNAMGNFQRKIAEFDTVAKGTFQRLLESVGGRNSVANGIEAATQAMVFFGSIAGDVIGAASQSFENLFGAVQAVTLLLSGDMALAKELIKDLGEETDEAASNFLNMFERATAEVDKFKELSTQSAQVNKDLAKTTGTVFSNEKKVTDEKKKQLDLERQRKKELEEALAFGDDDIKKLSAKTNLEKQLFELQATELEKQILKIDERYQGEIEKIQELALISGETQTAQAVADELRKQRQIEINGLQEEGAKKTLETVEASTGEILGAMAQSYDIAGQMVTEFAGQNKAAQERAFAINKAISVASITMKTAEAIIAAQSQPPPLNVISAVNAAAVGAAQMAKVQSSQPSFHMGGMAPDETNARLQRGEGILSAQAVRRIGGEKGLDRIERGEGVEKETVVIIQPFKHFGRFAKELGYKKPKQTGVGAY
jgi:hypothetical protein